MQTCQLWGFAGVCICLMNQQVRFLIAPIWLTAWMIFLAQIFWHSRSSIQKLLRTIIIPKMENWGRRQHHQTDHRGARCGGFLNTLMPVYSHATGVSGHIVQWSKDTRSQNSRSERVSTYIYKCSRALLEV